MNSNDNTPPVESDDAKIHLLLNKQQDNLQAAVEQLARNMEFYSQYTKQLARIRRMAYDAYIVEGFTEQQATILCQNMLMGG